MEEPFILTVHYKGSVRDYEAQLQLLGYTYKFRVIVEGTEIFFERDEEGSYRAVMPTNITEKEVHKLDRGLLKLIAERLEAILS